MNSRYALLIFLAILCNTGWSQDKSKIDIDIIYDDNRAYRQFMEVVSAEIESLLGHRYEIGIRRNEVEGVNGESQKKIDSLFSGKSDVLISLGFTSSSLISSLDEYAIPCIGGISLQRSVKETTGIHNYNYLQSPFSIQEDLELLDSIHPFERLGIFVVQGMGPYIEVFFNEISYDFELEIVPITDDPKFDINQLSEAVDAIYFLPDLYDDEDTEQVLIDEINRRKLPSFSLLGRRQVEKGILASLSSSNYLNVYARRIALSVMKIMEGEDAANLPIQINGIEEDFVINAETMRQIEIYPPFELLSRASFVELNNLSGKNYTLPGAIAEALQNNLSLLANRKNVNLQNQEVSIAKTNLLPNVDASSTIVSLDNKSAEFLKSANQLTPQTLWSGNVELKQLIYSEPVLANIAIQKSLLRAEEEGIESQQLDLVLDVSIAYMRYLQAQANLDIQNSNVRTTIQNLNIAKTKAKIGSISLADVYGFESQLAINKISLNDAQTNVDQAKIRFNQLLNRPLAEDFVLMDVELEDEVMFVTDERIADGLTSLYDIRRLGDFFADYTFRHAPEIKQLNWYIMAQERSLKSNKRSLYQPELALLANVDKSLGRYGTRTPTETFEALGYDPFNPTWNVAFNASLPLFQGNLRNIKIQKDKIAVDQLIADKMALQQNLDANIRISLENLANSYNSILYARKGASSSKEFLRIIQDLYREGVSSIASVLDAQNNAVSAQLSAVSARYQFFIDGVTIERLFNNIYMLASQAEKSAFVEAYFDYIMQKED